MNAYAPWRAAAIVAGASFMLHAVAQAPGEDPVTLRGHLSVAMQPTGPAPRSGNMDVDPGIPSWMRARITRYEARAFSANPGNDILTDNDVVTTTNAEGMKKTCVQEVGSSTVSATSPGMKYGPNQRDQVVVLRGDLVNICK